MSDTVHLVVCMAAMCGLRYLIRPGPALVSLIGSSERRWEQVLSLCQGGKEGRLYMSPLAVGRASGTPPGLSCRCKVPETFCDRADTSPKQLTNKQTNSYLCFVLNSMKIFKISCITNTDYTNEF